MPDAFNQNDNVPWYISIEEFIGDTNPPIFPDKVMERLVRFYRRFDIYAVAPDDIRFSELTKYDGFNRWREKKHLRRTGDKLVKALHAYQEVKQYTPNGSEEETAHTKLLTAIRRIIDIELTKMEITQLKMVSKVQNLTRQEEKELKKKLKEDREAVEKLFIAKKSAEKISYYNHAETFGLHHTATLFNRYERKTHYSRSITAKSFKLSTLFTILGFARDMGATAMARVSRFITPMLQTLGTALAFCPYISSIAYSIGLIALLYKLLLNDKSKVKIATTMTLLVVTIASIATMGSAIPAIAALSTVLMAIGITLAYLIPLIKVCKAILSKEADLDLCLEKIESGRCDPDHLDRVEKLILLEKLETAWLNSRMDISTLNQAKNSILDGTMDRSNDLIKLLVGKNDPKEFLIAALKERCGILTPQLPKAKIINAQQTLKNEIKDLASQFIQLSQKAIFALLGLSAAVLLALRNAPPMLVTSLLVVGALPSITYLYRSAIARIFIKNTSVDPTHSTANSTHYTLIKKLRHIFTIINEPIVNNTHTPKPATTQHDHSPKVKDRATPTPSSHPRRRRGG